MKRKGLGRLGLLALVLVTAMLWVHPALAVPPLPAGFYGTVTDATTGGAAAVDLVVEASAGGVVFGQTTTFSSGGLTVYTLDVRGDDPDTPQKDGATPGDVIVFSVAGVATDQRATWQGGSSLRQDLMKKTAGSGEQAAPPPPPPPPPIQVIPPPSVEGAVTSVVQPTEQTTALLEDGTTIQVPPLTLPVAAQIQARFRPAADIASLPQGEVRRVLEINLFEASGNRRGATTLAKEITIDLPLTVDDLAAIGNNTANVEVYTAETEAGPWSRLTSFSLDLSGKALRIRVNHLSLFAVVVPAPEQQVAPTPTPTATPTATPTGTASPTRTPQLPSTGGVAPGQTTVLTVLLSGLALLLLGLYLLRRPRERGQRD